MLVVGTSGVVYPAAGLARSTRGKVVVLNPARERPRRCRRCGAAWHRGRTAAVLLEE
jgi:NAD-dependent SIR2 family protein deacetylase